MQTIKISSTRTSQYLQALSIRKEVFVLEQNVPEEIEVDQYEESCEHFLTLINGQAVGTGRLRVKENYIKFERIATLKKFRGQGVGQNLMDVMLKYAKSEYPQLIPYMHSQLDAVPFYKKIGWIPQGEVFFEANIPHLVMLKLDTH